MSEPVKVLGISGSPRRHGNTETLLDAVLEGGREAGAGVEKIVLRSLDYASCRGCNACHRTGVCIIQDDLTPVFEKIAAADVLAVASPIYSMGITAELKGLIDRSQYIWARKFILKNLYFTTEHMRRHKGIFISTAGLGWENVFDAAFPAITAFFNTTGFEYWDNVIVNNLDHYGGIAEHPTALAEGRAKGQEVVGLLQKMQASRDTEA
ncbi:MAG TPA: flavodoxin family protein [Candidatus Methanoculleus thermohydrogenotrophicum]|jgi:multimeric flavodoxin WrbA|nr:flavodoxin family protein [Candidatus Methanoculleus thermohydrogenotrophicum]NLM82362.1 flavodoxin family protein [Candidatus Methanoculleus thermohydrogenotrophicum]HOB17208.1 flavodoxin family protein [Candidatus Methanoculleus thermohydrogenotrophicum]HPZ37288.1 flavodoxin family protein [Candidatus Methanoculleus thermohydrogenotrophicum]HQC90499.1 flavodoxin family protein [Candidatus Methanoculleus thermohydrogenotrophicum]